jgi:alanine racemase
MVRAGIIMYGYPASDNTFDKIDLKPVATLKSKISFIKEVPEGMSISYGRRFITDKKMKIATIGIGYADGIRRSLSNRGYVIINGCKCKIVGSVCMDSFLIDVTELDSVSVGDLVYIWDNELITLEEVAKWYDTINYEVISTISDRVPRIFVKK